jgi:hypothetical protein
MVVSTAEVHNNYYYIPLMNVLQDNILSEIEVRGYYFAGSMTVPNVNSSKTAPAPLFDGLGFDFLIEIREALWYSRARSKGRYRCKSEGSLSIPSAN